MSKFTTALCAFAFVFAVALPAYAEEEQTTAGTNTTTSASEATTPATPTLFKQGTHAGQGDWAARNKEMVEKYRKMLAEKRASSTPGEKGKRFANASSTCIQKAVDSRETTVATSWTKLATSVTTALSVRQKALFDAWGLSDGTSRTTAIKAAWETWKKSHRDAFRTLKTDRDTAWKTFRTTVKDECKIALPKEETAGTDATGSVTL